MEQPKYFIVKKEYQSTSVDAPTLKKTFTAGKMVTRREQVTEDTSKIVTSDGYAIPYSYLEEIKDQEAIKNLQNMQASVKKILSRDFLSDTIKANKYSANGAVWGCMAGIGYGWIFKKNVVWSGFIGTLLGGFTGYGFSKINIKTKPPVKAPEKVEEEE